MSRLTSARAWLRALIAAIFDPDPVKKGEADWFVRLSGRKEDKKRLMGGGTLIGDGTWVLTAAHVVDPDRPKWAFLEAYSTADLKNPVRVVDICIHPGSGEAPAGGSNYLPNDVALVKLQRGGERVLGLPSETPPEGTPGRVYGWGYSKETDKISNRLNKNRTEVKILKDEGESFQATSMACSADSGGPFVVGTVVVGVYKGDNMGGDCSSAPDHYAAVAHHRRWIEDVMAGRGRCKPSPG